LPAGSDLTAVAVSFDSLAVVAADCPVTFGAAETVAANSAADEPVVAERPVVFHSGILHRTMKLLYGLWQKDWRDIVFDRT